MIHIQIPNSLLMQHKILADDSSKLKKDLSSLSERQNNKPFLGIINYLISNLEKIVSCSFEDLKKIQMEYLTLVYDLKDLLLISNKVKNDFLILLSNISNAFLKAYDNFTKRSNVSWNSYIFLKKLNQVVCPYCNANFIHTVQSNQFLSGASSRGMADLDHFLPKSIFPIFAITLSNLVPSCIYCNQRFKSAYYTSFTRNFSPYDKNLVNKFKFKFIYSKDDFKSAFEKLGEVEGAGFSKEERYYLDLTSKNDLFDFEKIEEFNKDEEDLNKIYESLLEIKEFNSENEAMYKCILKISQSLHIYFMKLRQLMSLGELEALELNEKLISELSIEYGKILTERKKYESQKKKNSIQRKCITAVKNTIEKNFNKVQKTYNFNKIFILDEIKTIKKVNFVDIALGKSEDYKIGIHANCESDTEKYMIYNNVALFQLESVYNEYRGYVNKKIEQSYILNALYKSQLKKQFPNLFDEYSIDNLSSLILNDEENQKNEILGKLIYDLVLSNVKAQSST
ncbi:MULTISPECIES: hypothetical protein [Exiguobacterium]|uniref:hypothetical protein n=1 Tax=Exiguobacterium TaxID=33986 RepID=UPI0004947406|nr:MULTISPECIES: hypothetical protein [Exiguobacterium]HCD58075.1 hypothetical protein [Exiguobacterium sp.]